jgi:nucleoside-diphosphate-sugar epimerase
METKNYKKYLSVLLWLLGFHSLAVGIGLLTLPSSFLTNFGLLEEKESFFQAQGGAFHVAMSLAYCMAAINAGKSQRLVRFVIYVKLLAFVFLLSYYIFVSPVWFILFSGVADGAMGVMVLILFVLNKKPQDVVTGDFIPAKVLLKKTYPEFISDEEKKILSKAAETQKVTGKSAAFKLPAIILTGASGLIGKYLLDELKNEYRIFAIARRSQQECNAPRHPNIAWIRADVSNKNSISRAFREIKTAGGADFMIHLAAYYDFINDYHPQYQITNVGGTRNVLDLAEEMNLKFFIFASSVAACSFPEDGEYIDEESAPDGLHIYSQCKRIGEEMVQEFAKHTPSCIVRFGAVFSDWCEYPPLYSFLNTWLGDSWRAKILAGRGNSAIPYIHIRDVTLFLRKLLKNYKELKTGEVLIASTNGATTHRQLFKLATRYYFGKELKPVLMPKFLCAFGVYVISVLRKFLYKEVFEQPWMIKYIDKQLNVRLRKTPEILKWEPDNHLFIEKRFPFLIERMKSEPLAWQMRNLMILRKTAARIDFYIYSYLADAEEELTDQIADKIINMKDTRFYNHFAKIDPDEFKWFIKLIYRLILMEVNSNNKLLIQNYFEASGINRLRSKYELEEIVFILKKINNEIIDYLMQVELIKDFKKEFYDFITLPIEFGIDEVERQYKSIDQEKISSEKEEAKTPREKLEETIWSCLVNRK